MKFAKITTILLWVIMGISIFLIISLLSSLDANVADEGMLTWISTNLYWTYALLGIATAASLVLEFAYIITDKVAMKSTLSALGFMVGVIVISYIFSDSEIPKFFGAEKFVQDGTITPTVMLWIGTGLIATYILSAISMVAIIWSSVSNVFK